MHLVWPPARLLLKFDSSLVSKPFVPTSHHEDLDFLLPTPMTLPRPTGGRSAGLSFSKPTLPGFSWTMAAIFKATGQVGPAWAHNLSEALQLFTLVLTKRSMTWTLTALRYAHKESPSKTWINCSKRRWLHLVSVQVDDALWRRATLLSRCCCSTCNGGSCHCSCLRLSAAQSCCRVWLCLCTAWTTIPGPLLKCCALATAAPYCFLSPRIPRAVQHSGYEYCTHHCRGTSGTVSQFLLTTTERERERERESEIKYRHGAKQREATQHSTRSTANKN